jgi:hypothetical protein
MSTEVRKWHSKGAEVDIITCLPVDVRAAPMFKADESGKLIPVPPGKSINGN